MRTAGVAKAFDNLVQWSLRKEWAPYREQVFEDHFGPLCDEFNIAEEEIADRLGGAFDMVFGCVLEDFFTARFGEEGEKNVIDDYLKRRGWREKVPAKRYLEALRDSFPSIYEVIELDPGRSMTVRDLVLGGDPVTVEEKLGSETAARWDRVAARLVTANNRLQFTGGLLLLPHEVADEVLSGIEEAAKALAKALRKAAKKHGETADFKAADLLPMVLYESTGPIIRTWLAYALARALAPLPELQNTDGDELLFSEIRFPMVGEVAEIVAALDRIEEVERDDADELRWSWLAPISRPRRSPQGKGLAIVTENDAGQTILGSIEIANDTMVLSTNSKERADRGRELLMSRLVGLFDPPVTTHRTPESMLGDRSDPAPVEPDLPPEVAADAIHFFLDGHYRQTLDEPLPYLGGKTPRQAAKTKRGRERAIGWLKTLENSEARRAAKEGQAPYDFQWMWRELRLGEPG